MFALVLCNIYPQAGQWLWVFGAFLFFFFYFAYLNILSQHAASK